MSFYRGGQMTIADAAGNQQMTICSDAAMAAARGNPAATGLMNQCTALRGINIAAGDLVLDAAPIDATMRVNLAYTGERIIAGSPSLLKFANTLGAGSAAGINLDTTEARRGFAIGVKVKSAIGGLNPAYAAAVRATLSAENQRGFDLAINGAGQSAAVSASNPTGASSGITTTEIAVGAVVVVGLGALLYKFVL